MELGERLASPLVHVHWKNSISINSVKIFIYIFDLLKKFSSADYFSLCAVISYRLSGFERLFQLNWYWKGILRSHCSTQFFDSILSNTLKCYSNEVFSIEKCYLYKSNPFKLFAFKKKMYVLYLTDAYSSFHKVSESIFRLHKR